MIQKLNINGIFVLYIKKIMPAVLDDHDSISRSKMSNALVTGIIKKLGNSIEQYIENEDLQTSPHFYIY